MSKTYEFLRESGVFFVLTMDGDAPAGRPFGAVMECDGTLYISTANTKAVYRQLTENPQVQIVALKPGTRSWIRISGRAVECTDAGRKQQMLEICPVLRKRFDSAQCPQFALFGITEYTAYLNTDAGITQID